MTVNEVLGTLCVIPDIDSYKRVTAFSVLWPKALNQWRFNFAWGTPTRPEVEEDRVLYVIRKDKPRSVESR